MIDRLLGHRGPSETERLLQRYLELQVRELEVRQATEAEAARQAEVKAEVNQLITYLVLVIAYALVLGVFSQAQILRALFDPHKLGQDIQNAATVGNEVVNAVPDALRGLVISSLTTVALLFVRGGSMSWRADLGGVAYLGGVVLALVGISGAAASGTIGLLAAVPGLGAALLVTYQFCQLLTRIRPPGLEAGQGVHAPAIRRLRSGLAAVAGAMEPNTSAMLTALFLAVPVVSVAVAAVGNLTPAAATQGGPMFVPTLLSYCALLAWSAWACIVTPAAVRIPIWSLLPWSLIVISVFGFDVVPVILVLAVLALLFVNVIVFTLDGRRVSSRSRSLP